MQLSMHRISKPSETKFQKKKRTERERGRKKAKGEQPHFATVSLHYVYFIQQIKNLNHPFHIFEVEEKHRSSILQSIKV